MLCAITYSYNPMSKDQTSQPSICQENWESDCTYIGRRGDFLMPAAPANLPASDPPKIFFTELSSSFITKLRKERKKWTERGPGKLIGNLRVKIPPSSVFITLYWSMLLIAHRGWMIQKIK